MICNWRECIIYFRITTMHISTFCFSELFSCIIRLIRCSITFFYEVCNDCIGPQMCVWRDLWHVKLLFSNLMLLRSLAVLAWDSQRFPWNLRACCSTLTPSLSITWLGRGVWDPYSSLSVCTCVKCLFLKYSHSLSFLNCSAFILYVWTFFISKI